MLKTTLLRLQMRFLSEFTAILIPLKNKKYLKILVNDLFIFCCRSTIHTCEKEAVVQSLTEPGKPVLNNNNHLKSGISNDAVAQS